MNTDTDRLNFLDGHFHQKPMNPGMVNSIPARLEFHFRDDGEKPVRQIIDEMMAENWAGDETNTIPPTP